VITEMSMFPAGRFSDLKTQTRRLKWQHHPNLRTRPHAPNKGRGRLQVQIQRAFMAGGPVLSTSAIFDWAYARGSRLQGNRRWSVHRILRECCEPVGRAPTIGRPILWRAR
jgi:hypothetical protein